MNTAIMEPKAHSGLVCTDRNVYIEKISSNKTEALFITLALVSFLLTLWRVGATGWNILAYVSFCFFCFFCFYSLNYRTLLIRVTPHALKLRFGIFSWVIPIENIRTADLDELPAFMRYGGAGIHFMTVNSRYRASFHFLEYPRIVIGLKRKTGPVQDVSFSTCRPDLLLKLLHEQISNVRIGEGVQIPTRPEPG